MTKEESFTKLVSFKINYMNLMKNNKKEFRETFLEMFTVDGDENNTKFFNECTDDELMDICMCFEQFILVYPKFSYKDLGIVKYQSEHHRYILFTTSDVVRDDETNEIIKIRDEAAILFQIRGFTEKNHTVKPYFDYSILSKLGRANEDEKYIRVARLMLDMVNDARRIDRYEGEKVTICNSKLRILYYKYKRMDLLLKKAKQGEQTEDVVDLIKRLEIHKSDLKVQLEKMIQEIEDKYKDPNFDSKSYRDNLEEEAVRIFEGRAAKGKKEISEPCTDEQNQEAEANRRKIEVDFH